MPSGRSANSTRRFRISIRSAEDLRKPDHFHLPLEDLELLLLQGRGAEGDDERIATLGDRIEEPPDEHQHGVERVVRNQVLDPVEQDGAPRLLPHEVLDLVDEPLQGWGDGLLRRPLAVREPQHPPRRKVVGLPDALRVRPGDDQAAAPATEEIRQEPERLRGSLLLYQVAAAWCELVVDRWGDRRAGRPLILRGPLLRRWRDRFRGGLRGRTGQDLAGEVLRDRAIHQRRERDDPVEGPTELPDVVVDEIRDARQHLAFDRDVLVARAMLEDRDSHQEVRRLDSGDEARFESGDEALVEVGDRLRGAIAREDDLLLRVVQVVEGVEEFLVNLRHATQKLDVIDHEAIQAPHPFSERGQGADLLRVGEARRERLAGHVHHLRFLRMGYDVVPDRVEEMGLPEPRARGDEERIVFLRRLFRDRHRGAVGESVALPDDERLERVRLDNVRLGIPSGLRFLEDLSREVLRGVWTAVGPQRLLLLHHEIQDLPRPCLRVPPPLHLELATGFDLAQAIHGVSEALDLCVDVRVSHGVFQSIPEDGGSGFESGDIKSRQDLADGLRLLHPVAHRDDGRGEDRRFGLEVRFDGGYVVPPVLPRTDLLLDVRPLHRLRNLRLLDDLRGALEDRVRVLPDEAVHVHARMEFEDARLVVRVLPHFLQGAAPAVLGPVAVVQARFGVPAAKEDDSLGSFPAPASDRPDVAGERVLLQIEEELLERVGTASRGTDEFTLWQEEVLGRMAPSVATAHSRGSSK